MHCVFTDETPQSVIVDISKVKPKFKKLIDRGLATKDRRLILEWDEIDPDDGWCLFVKETPWNKKATVSMPCEVHEEISVYEKEW